MLERDKTTYSKVMGEEFLPKQVTFDLYRTTIESEAKAYAKRAKQEAEQLELPVKTEHEYIAEFLLQKLCKTYDECCHWAHIARITLGKLNQTKK